MKAKVKSSVRNQPEDVEMYKEVEWEYGKSEKSRQERKAKKKPTSVALSEETINQLKKIAEEKGIPYQVLMRSYILKGIKDESN